MNILLSIAIVFLVIALFNLLKRQTEAEEEIDNIASYKADDTRLNEMAHRLDGLDDQTKAAIAKMEAIAADIGRLEEEHAQDHRDLVDIRQRYVLYRDKPDNGAGVPWAKDYECREEADHAEND